MAGGERDFKTIRRGIGESVDGVRPEIVILSLLAVADYRRAGRLETFDCIPNGGIIKRIQLWIVIVSCYLDRLNQFKWSWNAANRLGCNGHVTLSVLRITSSAATRTCDRICVQRLLIFYSCVGVRLKLVRFRHHNNRVAAIKNAPIPESNELPFSAVEDIEFRLTLEGLIT